MDRKKVHASHQMKDNDWGGDWHCTMGCTVCGYMYCYLCPDGSVCDDDELKQSCIGFDWTKGIYDGDRLIGRKSGTGWPKPTNKLPKLTKADLV